MIASLIDQNQFWNCQWWYTGVKITSVYMRMYRAALATTNAYFIGQVKLRLTICRALMRAVLILIW